MGMFAGQGQGQAQGGGMNPLLGMLLQGLFTHYMGQQQRQGGQQMGGSQTGAPPQGNAPKPPGTPATQGHYGANMGPMKNPNQGAGTLKTSAPHLGLLPPINSGVGYGGQRPMGFGGGGRGLAGGPGFGGQANMGGSGMPQLPSQVPTFWGGGSEGN